MFVYTLLWIQVSVDLVQVDSRCDLTSKRFTCLVLYYSYLGTVFSLTQVLTADNTSAVGT